jgi:hypothetical protein
MLIGMGSTSQRNMQASAAPHTRLRRTSPNTARRLLMALASARGTSLVYTAVGKRVGVVDEKACSMKATAGLD